MRRRHTSDLRSKLILIALSVILTLAGAEAVLRLINYPPRELALFRANPNGTGSYRLRSDLDIVTTFGTKDIRIKTNSNGMRWREVSPSKRSRTTRVAFVGDSFTFGLWADNVEQSLVGVFESELSGNGVEALNFGVPGYGLADVELLIREQVLSFSPDYIILLLFNGNDLLDSYLGLERYSVSGDGVLQANSEILEQKIPEEFRREARSIRRFLADRIYLVRVLKAGLIALFPRDKSRKTRTTPVDTSYTSDLFWSQRSYPDFAINARDMTLEALMRIAILCQQNQVKLRIAAIPSMEQMRSPAEFGDDYHRDLPQRYFAEFAATNAIPFMDLLPGLVQHVRESGEEVYYLADGHFNNQGHRVVGTLLTSFFAKRAETVLRHSE